MNIGLVLPESRSQSDAVQLKVHTVDTFASEEPLNILGYNNQPIKWWDIRPTSASAY